MEAMLALPETTRDCDNRKVMNLHHEILRLSALGMKGVDVAQILCCTPQTVYNVTNGELGRSILARLNGERDKNATDVAKRIEEISEYAVEVIDEALRDKEAGLNLRVATSFRILDRAGHGPVQKIRGNFNHALFGREEIEEIKRNALAAGVANGMIVDVVPE